MLCQSGINRLSRNHYFKHMKKILAVVIVLVVVAAIAASINKKENTSGGNAPIKIGAIISQTGVAAQFGEMSQKGIDLAVKEINSNGGIEGRKVEVIYEDDRTDPKIAAGLYHKLRGIDGVSAIIGSNFDFVTQPVFALASTSDTVIISPSNPRIAGIFDTNKNSFVMMSDFDKIIGAFDDYLKNESFNKLGIVRFNSGFSEEITRVLNDMVVAMGKPKISEQIYQEIGSNDFRTAILKLKQENVDLVFLDMIGPDPVLFMNQAKQLGYNPKVISHDGIRDAMAVKGTDPKIFNEVVIVNWNVSTKAFEDKFKAAYGIEQTNSANRAYDAVYVLAQAAAKTKNKSEIPNYLVATDFTTPNGEFDFSHEHSAENTEVKLMIVKNGVFEDYK